MNQGRQKETKKKIIEIINKVKKIKQEKQKKESIQMYLIKNERKSLFVKVFIKRIFSRATSFSFGAYFLASFMSYISFFKFFFEK